ncbi:hypothetical protein RB195_010752 [Necator americanus]|uniref:Uncharacterized protein n=1 Tax=Necator americanus TaxID=51031 RepID=A0ABR1CZC7_NECAM
MMLSQEVLKKCRVLPQYINPLAAQNLLPQKIDRHGDVASIPETPQSSQPDLKKVNCEFHYEANIALENPQLNVAAWRKIKKRRKELDDGNNTSGNDEWRDLRTEHGVA